MVMFNFCIAQHLLINLIWLLSTYSVANCDKNGILNFIAF